MNEETLIKQCIYDSCTDLKETNKLISYFENIQKENIQLKIQLLEKKCSDKDIEYKEKIKLQQRIVKAIDYIEETTKRNDELNCTKLLAVNQVEQLLEILEGKSE